MSFTSKTGCAVVKNARQHLCTVGSNKTVDLFRLSSHSKDLKLKSIPKKDLVKMISLIQEEERVKLGHELHDGVSPMLAIAKLYLDFVTSKTELETFAIDQVKAAIFTAIENIRGLSSQLVVSQKIHCNLVHLIAQLAKTVGEVKLFKIQFTHSPEDEVSEINPETKLALYRIVQEQLNNIIKHSKASYVEIRLFWKKEILRLVICDDGVGFDTTKLADGIGLTNIEARIKQLSGQLKVKSSPNKGCMLDISLSLS